MSDSRPTSDVFAEQGRDERTRSVSTMHDAFSEYLYSRAAGDTEGPMSPKQEIPRGRLVGGGIIPQLSKRQAGLKATVKRS